MRSFLILCLFFITSSSFAQLSQILEEKKLISNRSIIFFDQFKKEEESNQNDFKLIISNNGEYFFSSFLLQPYDLEEYHIWNKHESKSGYTLSSYKNLDYNNNYEPSVKVNTIFVELNLEVFYLFDNECLAIKYGNKTCYYILRNAMFRNDKFIFIFDRI